MSNNNFTCFYDFFFDVLRFSQRDQQMFYHEELDHNSIANQNAAFMKVTVWLVVEVKRGLTRLIVFYKGH